MQQKESLLFAGTPWFAQQMLETLIKDGYRIHAVITTPDKPVGRGMKLTPTPVKRYAEEQGLQVFQPKSLKKLLLTEGEVSAETSKDEELKRFVSHCKQNPPPTCLVTAAYGKILPRSILEIPARGAVNVHPSLLPRWRGAAPIQHTIFAGDNETGVCLMEVDEGLDTGPIYACERMAVTEDDTAGSLQTKLVTLSKTMLLATLPKILSGQLQSTPQPDTGATYAEKWEREDTFIQWEEPAEVTVRRVRASSPKPGARAMFQGAQVKIAEASVASFDLSEEIEPGRIIQVTPDMLLVGAGEQSILKLEALQFPGKKVLSVKELLNGMDISKGEQFSSIRTND